MQEIKPIIGCIEQEWQRAQPQPQRAPGPHGHEPVEDHAGVQRTRRLRPHQPEAAQGAAAPGLLLPGHHLPLQIRSGHTAAVTMLQ